MNASAGLSTSPSSADGSSWGFHIRDAGSPPSMLATSLWVFLSLNVAALFLEVRPAAIRRVRAAAETPSHAIPEEVRRAAQARRLWSLVVAVWSLALYDVVHRTCSYCVLSPHMLVRRRLLPLGSTFLWDGLWTEWVNWVRFYLFCTPTASSAPVHVSAATTFSGEKCADFQLPLAGGLPFEQYPEYAALRPSEPATADEVTVFRQVGLTSLAITWVILVAVHAQFAVVCRVYFSDGVEEQTENSGGVKSAVEDCRQTTGTAEQRRSGSGPPPRTGATGAPGDDSWVDSPEALAEEERWRKEGLLSSDDAASNALGAASRPRAGSSSTTRILLQCWPSLLSTTYAALFALMGGLPLCMQLLFPAATVIVSVTAMLVIV